MKKVYVAGPYSTNPRAGVHQATVVGENLFLAGFYPFIPHLYHFWNNLFPHEYEEWMKMCFAWLEKCDYVLRIPGESEGADREVTLAEEKEIPVFHDMRDLLQYTTWKKENLD